MTTAEITALRKELEVALLTVFTDFKRLTGVSITAIDVQSVSIHEMQRQRPDIHVCGVSVVLESL